jgi:para-nitrobenzyl esterase
MQPVQLVQFLFLGLFGFFGLLGVEAYAGGPIVHTKYGDVRGVAEGQVESFMNLPFARPPTGKLRWMPPQEPDSWTNTRDASHFSAQCPQKRQTDQIFVGNEDCLYLNVFKPTGATGLPVIVFIHGGSQIWGSASFRALNQVAVYDGSRLAQNANVVVVTLNYRLGPLGYIGHPELSRTSGYGASGNYAYMDQIQALKWVKRNIAAFGGDPNNVTLSGHSAGATSVWILMTSPLSKSLFHRAIVHSGVREPRIPFSSAEEQGEKLARTLKCANANASDELACMRGKSAKAIIDAMPSVPGSEAYNAVVDRHVLFDSPIAVMRSGHYHHVPILQGNVEDERSLLGLKAAKDIKDQATYEMAVKETVQEGKFPDVSAEELLQHYPASDYPSFPQHWNSFAQAYHQIFTDAIYLCSSREVLRALRTHQTKFVGRFFYTHTYSDSPFVEYGASHGFELQFIFDTLGGAGVSPTADEAALVKTFQNTWSHFARTGTAPSWWKRYDAERDNYAIFDTPRSEGDHPHTKDHLRAKECDFWDEKYAKAPEFH